MPNEPVFSGFLEEEVEALANFAERVFVERGDTVFEGGSEDDALYITVSGRLSIIADRTDGGQVVFSDIGPGEIFGEIAFLDGLPRTATVIAETDCALLRLPRWRFEDLQTLYPSVASKITWDLARVLASRLRRSDLAIVDNTPASETITVSNLASLV